MKRVAYCLSVFMIGIFFLGFIAACKEKEVSKNDLVVGNWIQSRNRIYILWIASPTGEWSSSVKIPDVSGKIVKSRGHANGTWHIEDGQMILSVLESDVEDIWKKNDTSFFDIVGLTKDYMQLQDKSEYISEWKKTITEKEATAVTLESKIPLGPLAVNINKNRSNDKDRYLCLNMNLILQEMMPDKQLPAIHPRAKEAAIIFLSSLVFDNVKDFKSIKKQNKKLVAILNPYMDNSVKEIKIEHVIVTVDSDQVEEFIIEHTISDTLPAEEGETTEDSDKESEEKST